MVLDFLPRRLGLPQQYCRVRASPLARVSYKAHEWQGYPEKPQKRQCVSTGSENEFQYGKNVKRPREDKMLTPEEKLTQDFERAVYLLEEYQAEGAENVLTLDLRGLTRFDFGMDPNHNRQIHRIMDAIKLLDYSSDHIEFWVNRFACVDPKHTPKNLKVNPTLEEALRALSKNPIAIRICQTRIQMPYGIM